MDKLNKQYLLSYNNLFHVIENHMEEQLFYSMSRHKNSQLSKKSWMNFKEISWDRKYAAT